VSVTKTLNLPQIKASFNQNTPVLASLYIPFDLWYKNRTRRFRKPFPSIKGKDPKINRASILVKSLLLSAT
jgi:hypothetical protein